MNFLPIAINIEGKRIVIVGGGRVALHKATLLRRFTGSAVVISPCFREGFADLGFMLVTKRYEPHDIDGAFLVYVCTEDHQLNSRVKADAAQRGILCSVCDSPPLCDFISPAIYQHDGMMVAVTSNARDVRRSIRVRDKIKEAELF